MKVTLIKKYKFGAQDKPIGTDAEVTNGLGQTLIDKGIAELYKPKLAELPKKAKNTKKKEKEIVILQDNNQEKTPDTKD